MGDQFGYSRKSINDLQNIASGRKPPPQMNMMNFPPRARKQGFPGEDEDNETSQLFNSIRVPGEKEMVSGIMQSQSPSNLPGGFGQSSFYTPASLSMPQRPIGSGQFRNTATPTSMNPFPPMGLQQPPQQHSPNSISAIGARSMFGSQTPSGQLNSLQKRPNAATNFGGQGPMGNYSTFGGYGSSRSNAFGEQPALDLSDFPSLSSRSSVTPNPVPVNRTYGNSNCFMIPWRMGGCPPPNKHMKAPPIRNMNGPSTGNMNGPPTGNLNGPPKVTGPSNGNMNGPPTGNLNGPPKVTGPPTGNMNAPSTGGMKVWGNIFSIGQPSDRNQNVWGSVPPNRNMYGPPNANLIGPTNGNMNGPHNMDGQPSRPNNGQPNENTDGPSDGNMNGPPNETLKLNGPPNGTLKLNGPVDGNMNGPPNGTLKLNGPLDGNMNGPADFNMNIWRNVPPVLSVNDSESVPPNRPNTTDEGMVSKPPQEAAPEFNITQEEFPALPGSNPPQSDPSKSQSGTAGSFDAVGNRDGTRSATGTATGQVLKRGIQTHSDGMVSNIPQSMVMDQFGIVGLLAFIRATREECPQLMQLVPGMDLTTIGLNLNQAENLYSTFQSPWADAPCRPQDIDFHVPAEYLTNIYIREKLAPIKLNRYGEDLLFFLFYMNGSDVLQLAAAAELYNRDWRYHKEERVWMTRAPGMEPVHKTNTSERGTYYFFDANSWRKVAKDFHLEYDKLEDRPTLPQTLHHNPNMPTTPAH